MDEVHLLLRGDRIGDITAEELLHLRRQPARDLRAKRIRDAGDEYATRLEGRHYLQSNQCSLSPDLFRASPNIAVPTAVAGGRARPGGTWGDPDPPASLWIDPADRRCVGD